MSWNAYRPLTAVMLLPREILRLLALLMPTAPSMEPFIRIVVFRKVRSPVVEMLMLPLTTMFLFSQIWRSPTAQCPVPLYRQSPTLTKPSSLLLSPPQEELAWIRNRYIPYWLLVSLKSPVKFVAVTLKSRITIWLVLGYVMFANTSAMFFVCSTLVERLMTSVRLNPVPLSGVRLNTPTAKQGLLMVKFSERLTV